MHQKSKRIMQERKQTKSREERAVQSPDVVRTGSLVPWGGAMLSPAVAFGHRIHLRIEWLLRPGDNRASTP